MELTRLLDDPLPKGDLISKALNYLKNVWIPVMAYRHAGRYCIDNSMAERLIRPLTIERKNKITLLNKSYLLFFLLYGLYLKMIKKI